MIEDRPSPDDLAAENLRLREENRRLLNAIHAIAIERFDIDRADLLSQVGRKPSLMEFLNELETRAIPGNP